MVLNDLYHLYFRVQIHARSPILEYLTDPEFFSVVSVLFGGFYNGVCNGWYIAYDYNYEIYWRNYFDTESYLNRHIEIIQIATQYYGNVKSFENIMKMMYSEYNGQALIDDQIFIQEIARGFFDYTPVNSIFEAKNRFNSFYNDYARILNRSRDFFRNLSAIPIKNELNRFFASKILFTGV